MADRQVFNVLPADVGLRLDLFLHQKRPDLSRSYLQKLITAGFVMSSDGPLSTSYKIKEGYLIELTIPPSTPLIPQAENISLEIVFEDEDLLVINKPAGMVVHPGPGSETNTLVNALVFYLGSHLSQRGGIDRPGIVHRLDKGTSGLLIVAKNDLSHEGLSSQFATRTLSRTYQALVWGKMMPLQGTIDGDIARNPYHRQKMAVITTGKPARTHYRTLETFGSQASLIECQLETGRTHQIRVHLTSQGCPLIGDPTYGHPPRGTASALIQKLTAVQGTHQPFLHAWRLKFNHPRSAEEKNFTVDPPNTFKDALKVLKT